MPLSSGDMMPPSAFFSTWLNGLLAKLQKHEWRGKHRLYLWLSKHYGHKVITHKVKNRDFSVPVSEWCFWLEKGPENYYLDEFLPFCEKLNGLNKTFSFFDLGADIGTVSSLVAQHCPKLKNVLAFEPNSKAYAVLKHNLAQLNLPHQALNTAISNFQGQASFHADASRLNDHEGYIEKDPQGETSVMSLDHWLAKKNTLSLASTIVLKIDVEGQEIPLLEGAQQLIRQANLVVILIEVHPQVLARNKQTPEDLFEAAEQTRDFEWSVPAINNQLIDRSQALFNQVPEAQYDIIGVSKATH
ncbi:FkbM family methyltransferase [Paraglaciecola aestuariivivens]